MRESNARLIFITGASRSGTTLLSFVLRNHPEVCGLRELQFFGHAWDPRATDRRFTRAEAVEAAANLFAHQQQGVLQHRVGPAQREAAAGIVAALGPAATDPGEVFAATARALAAAAGKTIPCEQTPRNIFYARPLLGRYPQAHVVHIVRDPRAVMASQKNRWRRRSLATSGANMPRYEAVRVWVNYHPYTVARLWSQATRAALELRDHPRFTLIRYEDLVQQPEVTIRRLCDRLGLPFDPAMLEVRQVNSSHESSVGGAKRGMRLDAVDRWRHALTPAEIGVTERECDALMRRFDYEPVAARRKLLAEAALAVTYVAHLGAVLLVNPRRAAVQARALLQSSSAESLFDSRRLGVAAPLVAAARPVVAVGAAGVEAARSTSPANGPRPHDLTTLIGLQFWDVPLDRAAGFLVERARCAERTQVFFVNAHCVNEAARNPAYAGLLANAPFVFADGVGMAIAARFSGIRLVHNVNGTDLFPLLCDAAARAGVPIALLGARPGVAQTCASRMEKAYPGLRVVWTAHGFMSPEEEREKLRSLNQSGARILLVAKGVPAQECWIAEYASCIEAPVVLGVGALFDFYSGTVRRAPRIVRQLRGEWLYRLMLEPRRLARRYLLGNPAFIARTLLWRTVAQPLTRRQRSVP